MIIRRHCPECKHSKTTKIMEFMHKGLCFTGPKPSGHCEGCSRDEIISTFDEYNHPKRRGRLVHHDEDGLHVDWNEFFKNFENPGESTHKRRKILVWLGIFSKNPESNWAISNDRKIINEKLSGQRLFFTREKDAVAYATLYQARIPTTPLLIFRCSKVRTVKA